MWGLLILMLLPLAAHAAGLVDEPFLGDSVQYLDGNEWSALSSTGMQINVTVPGDIITDLERAGVIGDALYETVWINNASLWDDAAWTYTRTFELNNASWLSASAVYLIFDGIKMSTDISLNGILLGSAFNQFVRYVYNIKPYLKSGSNTLRVMFTINDSRMDPEDRFMACSGGWDWAPYSSLTSGQTPIGVRSLTKGLWKSVYVVPVTTVAITDVTPLVSYVGPYPMTPLTDSTKSSFNVTVRVFLTSVSSVSGTVSISSAWGAAQSTQITVNGDTIAQLVISAAPNQVDLWWPNGLGAQALYNITATWSPSSGVSPTISTDRRIGFRVFALVTDDDTNPSHIQSLQGSGNLTMRFKVNGANLWARGANWIPMENYDGRSDAVAINYAVQAAADAGMNVLRVWGGGIWEYDAFYDTADELGVMIYHDAMYSNQDDSYHMPTNSTSQQQELQHQIRRLATHPSIVIWDGCNECGGSGVVQGFVIPTIVAEDPSRTPWPSSPSSGWSSGVNRLSSLYDSTSFAVFSANAAITHVTGGVLQVGANYAGFPIYNVVKVSSAEQCLQACSNLSMCAVALFSGTECQLQGFSFQPVTQGGSGLIACIPFRNGSAASSYLPTTVPVYPHIEQHGPYQHGSGFPAVNGMGMDVPIDPMLPPSLKPVATYGPSAPGVFVSEFVEAGIDLKFSFESMSATLAPAHWSLHGGSPADTCSEGFYSRCNGSNVMAQRNYPCDIYYASYYGARATVPASAVGKLALQTQLYLCQLAAMLNLKSVIEWQRSQNLWGLMEWQLNEIWPTGGWGSIEYGTVGYTAGQVRGGRWKPLHYALSSSLFTDLMAACGSDGRCYVKNDNPLTGADLTLQLSLEQLEGGLHIPLANRSVSLPVGANAFQWFCAGSSTLPPAPCPQWNGFLPKFGCWANGSDCLLNVTLLDGAAIVYSNIQLLTMPASLMPSLSKQPVNFAIGQPQSDGSVPITLTAPASSLYVHLTTLASGRFSENSFSLISTLSKTVTFIPTDALNLPLLTSSLRVEHLGQYLV